MLGILNYKGIEFLVRKKGSPKIESKANININVFGFENNQMYSINLLKNLLQD